VNSLTPLETPPTARFDMMIELHCNVPGLSQKFSIVCCSCLRGLVAQHSSIALFAETPASFCRKRVAGLSYPYVSSTPALSGCGTGSHNTLAGVHY